MLDTEYDHVEKSGDFLLMANNIEVTLAEVSKISEKEILMRSDACCFDSQKQCFLDIHVDDMESVHDYDDKEGFAFVYSNEMNLFTVVHIKLI